jgi:carbon monoxide dehydrogenase subunit G
MDSIERGRSWTSFENVVEIRRPREEVFAFLADFENVPRWNPAIEVTRKISPGAVGVGTAYRQVRISPRKIDEEFEVAVFDPPRRLMLDGEIGPFRAEIGYAFESVAEGTRLTNSVELQPRSIISRVMVPLAASQIEASVASNLSLLKGILEGTRFA